MATIDQETARDGSTRASYKAIMGKVGSRIINAANEGKKLGVEDPRRIIHSLKVGLAITLVSLFYYFDPLYDGFGVYAMWAVITVVVVFEFSVGATLGRVVNRGAATFLAGSLGVGVHRLASFSDGRILEPVFLGLSCFIVASLVTFARFYPKIKARYDYGFVIFILTFCLISVSGYRNHDVLEKAHKRLSTVMIGGSASAVVCSLIRPVWAGEDLRKLVAGNIDNLAIFLEGFGQEYFKTSEDNPQHDKASMDGYKSVLSTKNTEESLANFAKWEPRYRRFRHCHPWDQYVKTGALVRECAYRVDALHGYLSSEMEEPPKVRPEIQECCTTMSSECSLALKELSSAIKKMTSSCPADPHIVNAKTEAKKLKLLQKTDLWKDTTEFLEIIHVASVCSLLIEIVACTVKIAQSVHELASKAKFNSNTSKQKESEKGAEIVRVPSIHGSHRISIPIE